MKNMADKDKVLKYFNGDELATSVWKNKYQLEGEETPDDMHKRLAKVFSDKEKERIINEKKYMLHELSDYGQKRRNLTFDRIYNYFKNFKYIIPQGSIMSGLGTDLPVSLSNCWVVQSPYDSYAGILRTDSEFAFYFKRRGGVGTDLSTLRPNGTPTKNSAKTTTGAVSFMHRYSNTTRETAMNGRRGASMLTMDIAHPDSLEFIKVKRDKTSVTGANISIRLRSDFMEAVKNGRDYYLRFPVEFDVEKIDKNILESLPYNELKEVEKNIYVKRIKAKEYWDEIIYSARNFAEPGLLYWDNILEYDPTSVYEKYKPISTNPCSEQAMNANESCRLMAMNLFSFVQNPFTEKSGIDYEKLYEVSYEMTRLGDTLVDLELDYIQRIIDKIKSDPEPDYIKRPELELWEKSYENAKSVRRMGIGITALGDMLAALGIKYDSKTALSTIEQVMKTKMQAELDATIDMAILFDPFEGYDFKKEYEVENDIDDDRKFYYSKNKFYEFLYNQFRGSVYRMERHGRRNINWSTIAPTGSVSILTQTTSGLEPLFSPYYMRRKKINENDANNTNTRVDFIDDNGDKWQEYPVFHPKFKDWIFTNYKGMNENNISELTKDDIDDLFKMSPWYKSTANDIDWKKRVEMQSLLQKYTTNAISSTINLPSTVTLEEVSEIYRYGYEMGLKGQTVYVDGSRDGVLVNVGDNKDNTEFKYTESVKRPKVIDGEAHTIQIAGQKYAVFVGFLNDLPYEVFVYGGTTKQGKGKIEKKESGNYVFIGNDENSRERILTDKMDTTQRISTRLVSGNLRHGRHFKFIIEDIEKEGAGIFDWFTAIKKALAKYLKDEDVKDRGNTCPSCGEQSLVYEEGCKVCKSCGWSACG